jgi:serine-type D-Ala-D-Ala carboxypeptidase/endopeptidase
VSDAGSKAARNARFGVTDDAARTVREITSMVADAPGCEIALAWMFKIADTETYSHDGATAGYSSYALFNPKGDYAAIVLVNITLDNTAFANLLGEHVAGRLEGEAPISLQN